MTEKSIIVNQLSKKYASQLALDALDLEIFKGEIFGLLGPNGAGKTTFFSILCGIITATSGSAIIEGYKLPQQLEEIKRIFGIVPQEIALYASLSGRNNLLYIGRMYGLKGKELHDRVDECLDHFGFSEDRNKLVKSYSGGMKRRINLLAGILHRPKVLLLDEPTVGVDVQTRAVMMGFLKNINNIDKTTILYTSHHLQEAEQFCDRVGVIDRGKLYDVAAPSELVNKYGVSTLEDVFLKLTGETLRN